jgi:hypothetical protein
MTLRELHDATAKLLAEGKDPELPVVFDASSASTAEGAASVNYALTRTVKPREELPDHELQHYDEDDLQPYEAIVLQE